MSTDHFVLTGFGRSDRHARASCGVRASFTCGSQSGSATVTRKDGHHPIIFMQCGPVRYRADARVAAKERPFAHTVHVRPTSFRPLTEADPDRRLQFHALYQQLMADEDRNRMICDDVREAVRDGRSPLVLTERKEHLQTLADRLEPHVNNLVTLCGGRGAMEKQVMQCPSLTSALPRVRRRRSCATSRAAGEAEFIPPGKSVKEKRERDVLHIALAFR